MSKSLKVKKGNEVFEIQDTDLQEAVNDGYLPTDSVIVANSKTNEVYEIAPEDLPSAFADGFTFQDIKKKEPSLAGSAIGAAVGAGTGGDGRSAGGVRKTAGQITDLHGLTRSATSTTTSSKEVEAQIVAKVQKEIAEKPYYFAERGEPEMESVFDKNLWEKLPEGDDIFAVGAKTKKRYTALTDAYRVRTLTKDEQKELNEFINYAPKTDGIVPPIIKTKVQEAVEAQKIADAKNQPKEKVLGYLQGLKEEDKRKAEEEAQRITDFTPNEYEANQKAYADAEKNPGTLPYDLAIANAEQQKGATISLQRNQTSLPNLSMISLGGAVTVNREDYINEQKRLRDEWLAKVNIPLLKEKADKSLEAVRKNLKENFGYVEKNFSTFTRKSQEGDVIPDPVSINNYAKSVAKKHGLSDEGYYKNLLYNEITANVAHKIIEPKVLARFEENYRKKYGKTLDEETSEEALKGFTEPEKVIGKAKIQVKNIADEISVAAKQEVDTLNSKVTEAAAAIKSEYEMAAPMAKTDQEAKQIYDAAVAKTDQLNREFLKEQNLINSKYNARYRRQIAEIERMANAKIQELVKSYKYERSPELQKKIQAEYQQAYKEVIGEREAFKEARDYSYGIVENFGRSFVTALGGAVKGISSSLGFDSGKVLGDVMNTMYQHGSTEIKTFRDFLDITKLSKSWGALGGGMMPSVIAAAATSFATGGGGTPAALRMLYTGLASWSAETADISGRMYEDRFAETGSAAVAEKSAKQSFSSQVALMPFYAFDGLPFMGKAVKLAKNIPGRILLGGTIEVATELLQEYPQNLFEEAIKNDKPYMEGLKLSSAERFKHTFLNIAPVFFMGGGGQAVGAISEARQNALVKSAAKSFALKSQFQELAPAQREQFLFDMMQRHGNIFTTAYVGGLFAGGKITEAESAELTNIIKLSNDVITNSGKYGLDPAKQKVYAALAFYKERYLKVAGEQTDPLFRQAAEAKVKNIENDMVKLASGEQVNYVVLTYPNNEQYVLTTQVAEEAIKNEKFASAYKNGDIKVATFGKRGAIQERLEQLDAEKAKGAQLSDKEQVVVDAIAAKDYSGSRVEPYTKVIQDPNSTVQEKKEALKGLSDQLLSTATAETTGTALGQKLSIMIEDLGHEAPVETKEVKEAAIQQPITKPELIKQAEQQEQKEVATDWSRDVESTTTALTDDIPFETLDRFLRKFEPNKGDWGAGKLSEAYHKARVDGSNPELVKAVEDLLGKPKSEQVGSVVDEGVATPATSETTVSDAEVLPIGEAAPQAPAKAKSKLAAFKEKHGGKPGAKQEVGKVKSMQLLPLKELEAELAGMKSKREQWLKQGKDKYDPEAFADLEKQIAEWEQAVTDSKKGKTTKEVLETEEVKAEPKAQPEKSTKQPIKLGSKEYSFIGVNKQGEEIYENDEGIRTKPASGGKGVFVTEPVSISPGKRGVEYSADRREEYMTTKELGAKEKKEVVTKPAKDAVRKIRDAKLLNDIDNAWDEFFNQGGSPLTSGGINPKKIEAGAKIISLYLKAGIYKFSDIAQDAYAKFGDKLGELFEELKGLYTYYYMTQATKEEAREMDFDVRSINFDDIISKFDTDDRSETSGGQSGIPETDVVPSGKAQSAVPGDETAGKRGIRDSKSREDEKDERGIDEDDERGPGTRNSSGRYDVPLNGNEGLNEELGGTSQDQPLGKPEDQTPVVSPLQHNGNFIIPPDFTNDDKSFNVAKKLQDNIDALRVLALIDKENREPTYEEQKVLFKYVGWGGIKEIAFDPNSSSGWVASNQSLRPKIAEAVEAIRELDPANFKKNYDAIRSSTLNAHYTAIPVIRGMWNVLRKGGFKGGNVLEPSAGVGHFIGAMPIDMVEKSRIIGIELDPITAKILEGLYPNHITRNAGYQEVSTKNADLIISNIPFGDYSVFDNNFLKSKDPVLKKATRKIHNYFFARAIEDARPGGLIAFVTSTGVLDAKGNSDLREMMADRTEFLGAIRLANNTFQNNANTQVTTDIIFLRKLEDAEKPAQRHRFIESKGAKAKHKDRDEVYTVNYNEYFHDNPEMMLGQVAAGSMYGASRDGLTDTMTLLPEPGLNVEQAITDLAGKIFSKEVTVKDQSDKKQKQQQERAKTLIDGKAKIGNIVEIADGVFGVVDNYDPDTGELSASTIRVEKKYAGAVKNMIALRDAVNNLYYSEIGNLGDELIEDNRAVLNEAYQKFRNENGTLLENKRLIERDIDDYNLLTLEKTDGKKVTGLADIFTKRIFKPYVRPEKAESISDAIVINLNETGSIDIDRVAGLLGITPEEAIQQSKGLLFKNPEGGFEVKDSYLSGNVRKKLDDARVAAMQDPFYEDNVRALEAVQPPNLSAAQIYAPISAAWVKNKYIEEFASEIFKQPVYIKRLSTGKANVEGGHGTNVQVGDEYGTSRMNGFELLEEAIQNRIPVVKDTYKDGDKTVTVVNQVETQKAIEKFEKIRQAFDNWVWKDDDRRTDLVNYYNENFNNTVIRKYDGSLLTFEGYAGELTPKKHQLDGAWMIMQQMGGILDHIVGSGKTLLMVLTAQKMKEMGLIKKPIIIGLKANTADLADRYRKSFPLAKILSPTEKDFTPEKRREFFAKIANNDWDAIIMTHDQFGKIPQSKEVQQELMQEEIDALEADVIAAKAGQMSKRDITNLEKRLNNLKTKLLQLQAMDKDSTLRDFQEMGIDFMFVDESQQFKNLTYSTLQRGVAGLGDPLGSNKAFNMLTAVRTLQKLYGADKGTVFASGTPISNTMVEMYLLFKYLRPFKMKEMGINTFDQWANTFARVGSEIEFGVTNSLKPKVRMREFMNVPEMAAMYREIADVRNDSNLELDKPGFKKTIRVKTNRNLPVFSTVTIGGDKFKVIGRIKGIEKNEFWVSLTSIGKDIKIPESGKITYEGAQIDYPNSEYSDGLLINIPPTQAQRKYAKQIQKFAETKEGRWIGRVLSENEEKAYMLLATNLASKMAIDMRLIDPTFPPSEEGKLAVAADTIVGRYNETEKHKGVQLVFSDLGTPKSSNTAENLFNLIESRGVVREEMEQIFGPAAYTDKPKYPSVREIRERVQEQLEWSDAEFEEAVIEANEDNFNVYQELKDKLVRRGIPENEIVFIHDFKSDTQRKKLFEEARAGKIRVIIGSTAKLGTGVNVQEKIVALHHIDVPWRPADMEQRNGRGIRQGNAVTKEFYDNELPVYMYATEATLDAYKYQLLATKQQFIDQAKTGDTVVREISEGEGDEENGVSFAAMTAMLSGNPVILEKAKIDKKVKELDNSRKAFEQEKYSMRDKISRTKMNIISFSEIVEGLKKDKELFNANVKWSDKGEIEYEATIDGKLYKEDEKREKGYKTARQKVGEKLFELKAEFEKSKGLKDGQQKVVGSINGFDIVLRYFESVREGRGVEIGIKSPVSDVSYSFTRGIDPVHAAIHIQKYIKDLQPEIDRLNYRVVEEKEELTQQEKYLESLPEEFPQKGEFEKALKEQQRLGGILSEMTKDGQLPSVEDLESLGQRLNGPSEDYNIEEGGVFAITENEIVMRVSDNETLKDAQQQNSRFYWYKDELAPEMPDDLDETDDFQVKEPIAEDVAEMRGIVRDFIEDGQTSLKDIQKAIAAELGDNSPEMASLVEEAYFEFTKTSAAVSPKILEDVIDTIRDFVERTVGGKVIVVDNEAQLNEIAAESKEEVAYMQSPDGKVLGFVKGDTVFLNGQQINLNTPVHEAGHIWMIWAAQNAPQHLQRGLELVEGSRYLQSVKASPFYQYQAAKLPPNQREAFFRKEALAAAIGDRGAQFVLEAKRSGFMRWLINLWKMVKEAVGLSSLSDEVMTTLTLDEFAKAVAVDIFKPQPQPAQPQRDVSGIKKALVPIESLMQMNVDRMSDNDLMAKGKELIESGKVKPELVIHRIIDSGRGVLTPEEVVGLIYYKRQLDNDLTDAYREWDERTNTGEPVGNAGVAISKLEDKVHNYQLMSVITAQQQSMSFRLRRKLLDSGFNLVKETLRYKRNNSGYIPPEVVEKFKEADRKIKELQREIEEQRKAFEKAEAERAIKDIQDAIAREEEMARRIAEGIEGATATVYESLPPKRKSYADKALSALARMRKTIRSRNYDATLGIPAAIIDAGIAAIEVAIKTGKTVVEAVEIGVNRIKKLLKGKPFNSEDQFRNDMLEGFSSEGVNIDGPDAKFKPRINDDGTITIPGRIIRDLVKSGIDNIEDLTDEVMKLIVPMLPDVTHRQVRDFITGYGKKVNMTKDEIAEKIAELKRVGRLLSELEDLENGKLKETDPQKRARITDRELELKAKVKLLSDRLIRELHIEPTDEDMQRRRDLKEDQLKQQIADLQERIREGDFAKAKKPKVTSDVIIDLEAKLQTLKDQVEREQEKARLKNKTWTEKLEDYLLELLTGIPRALVASLDFSATLVQGVMQWFLHPGYSFQALKESFLQFFSPKREETYINRLRSQPFYSLLKASGLPIGETNVKLSVKEGVFFLNFVNHLYDFIVTGLTLGYKPAATFAKSLNPFKASQRAYEGYLNHLRVQVFLHDARDYERRGYRFETDPDIFKQLAKNVGTTTGRADLGRKLEGQKFLDILFFSVRKLVSEIKLFTPVAFVHYAKMPREVRYRALLDFSRFVTGYVVLNAAIWALRKDWDDDDEEDHFWDITSSDFLSHKVGNTRIGLGSGMKSILVFMGRLWNGEYTDQTGRTTKLGERYGKEINSRWDLVESFFKGKASPGIAIGMRKLEDKKNMEMTDKEVIEGLVLPMWLQDIDDMKRDHPAEMSALLIGMSILGMAVRTPEPMKPGAKKVAKPQKPMKPKVVKQGLYKND